MAQRIVGRRDGKTYGVKVHSNGWCAQVDSVDTPLSEIPEAMHEPIRINVQEVCALHGWKDMSQR